MTSDNIKTFAGLNIDTSPRVSKGLCLGVYGPGGGGKTTVLADIVRSEHGSPALLVDAEGGSDSVIHLKPLGLDIIHVTKWAEIQSIRRKLKSEDHTYKTIIWDHISEIADMCKMAVAPNGIPEIQQWGKILAEMMEMIRESRSWTVTQNMNALFCVWEETEKDSLTEQIRNKVNLTNKFGAAFPGMVPMLGRLTVPGRAPEYIRKLSFAPSERTDAKYRVAKFDEAAKIPLELYLRSDTYFLKDFLATVKDGVPFPVERYAAPKNPNTRQ